MDSQIKKVMRKLSFDPKRRFKKLEIISLSALRKSKNKQKRGKSSWVIDRNVCQTYRKSDIHSTVLSEGL